MNKKKEIIVVCHNIRSAFNIGSIFRTADGAGEAKLILCGYCANSPHTKLEKVALGAQKFVPHERIWQTWRAIENLKKNGYHIIALEKTKEVYPKSPKARGTKNIFKARTKKPFALVLGNEIRGLSKEIIERCDQIVSIPMQGEKESLNVSVAFGIAIYQLTNN